MTKSETTNSYGGGAYRSSRIPALAPAKSKHEGFMDSPLFWGHYAELDSATELEYQLEAELHTTFERQERKGRKAHIFCDSQRWKFENVSRLPYFLFILKLMCFMFTFFVWGIKVATVSNSSFTIPMLSVLLAIGSLSLFGNRQAYAFLLMVFGAIVTASVIVWDKGALWGYWSDQTAFWFGMTLFFIALIGADALLWLYARFYTHDGSAFNRRQGTLTIARRFRKPFVAPFYEFDPYIQLQVTPHGGHDYVLWLRHRYTDTKVCLASKLHSLGLDKPDLMAFWDTLQRYMDIDQPLPDVPILEQSRHLDPVTAGHDKAQNRPPQRWRDMDVKTWRRKEARKLQEKLVAYPWQQQPCILRERIDPNLSIEAYYRQQEANGIHATPKGDDFDNIHRR